MMTITELELRRILEAKKGATFVGLVTETEVRMRKTGNPFKTVLKRSRINATFNFDYEKSVQRQQVREGAAVPTFVATDRAWGAHESLGVIRKGDKFYVQLKVEKSVKKPTFRELETGRKLKRAEFAAWEQTRSASSQPVEKEIIIRDYAFASILAVRMDGHSYRIVPNKVAQAEIAALTEPNQAERLAQVGQ